MTTGTRISAGEIGAPRRRVEDRRLLTGEGRFTDDATPEGAARAFVVRSPHAHARIRAIDTARAAALPGVLAVLTGADAAADGMRPIPHDPEWTGPPDAELRLPDGFEVAATPHLPLPVDTVRYCGEAVALVVAETAAVAADAGELVEVDYEPRPAVTDARAAMAGGAPVLWPDRANNLALTCEVGDRAAADAAFAAAACVVSLRSWVHRVTGAPLEPRAVVGEYDPAARRHILRTGSGRGAVQTRARLAATLGVPVERCRAVFGDMGGNFGTRNAFSPELALIPWAARRTGRPVKWTADRRECFLSDCHARDLVSQAALALDAEGNFLALRGVNTLNLGAYAVYFWPLRKGLSMMQGVYRIPAVHFRGHAVLTNTAPTAAETRRIAVATTATGARTGTAPSAAEMRRMAVATGPGAEPGTGPRVEPRTGPGVGPTGPGTGPAPAPAYRSPMRRPSPPRTRACPRISAAPSKGSATSPTGRAAIPTARTSARWRSTPRPAWCASWRGRGSTTSAARSIRSSCTARRRARSCRGWDRR